MGELNIDGVLSNRISEELFREKAGEEYGVYGRYGEKKLSLLFLFSVVGIIYKSLADHFDLIYFSSFAMAFVVYLHQAHILSKYKNDYTREFWLNQIRKNGGFDCKLYDSIESLLLKIMNEVKKTNVSPQFKINESNNLIVLLKNESKIGLESTLNSKATFRDPIADINIFDHNVLLSFNGIVLFEGIVRFNKASFDPKILSIETFNGEKLDQNYFYNSKPINVSLFTLKEVLNH